MFATESMRSSVCMENFDNAAPSTYMSVAPAASRSFVVQSDRKDGAQTEYIHEDVPTKKK